MTIRPLTRAEVRSLDDRAARELGLPTLALMENAGRGAAEILAKRTEQRASVLILCGPGNNGGDGGVVARHLDAWGYPTRAIWFASPGKLAPDAAVQYNVLARSGFQQQVWEDNPDPSELETLLSSADWVVDGLLGTGLSRPVTGPLRGVIAAVNRANKPVLALDLPSGLDTDTGQPLGVAVRATITASFVAPKAGFGAPGAEVYIGSVQVVEIGLPRLLLEPFRIA